VNREAATVMGQPDAAADAPEQPLVLVVDDEAGMRDSCKQVLERGGCRVRTAADALEALDAMTGALPDVVLMDLKMPGMSGEEFLREAREIDPEVVAVAITGYPTLDSAVEVMKAGAYDYLSKPFSAEQLRLSIERALQKRRLARAVAAGERERQLMHDNFIALVSHQLKSPAAAVKLLVETALARFGPQLPRDCTDLLERSAARAGLLLDLMDDWITLARLESGGATAAAQSVDLCGIARQAIASAREAAGHGDVGVELHESGPVIIRGDAEALRALLLNLIDNAIRYSPDGGRVSVEVRREGRSACVTVADTGPGIPADEMPLIFEPFFRGRQARQKPGTGLGLPIARQIARAHGGSLAARSEPGQGTTFKVHLPSGPEEQ